MCITETGLEMVYFFCFARLFAPANTTLCLFNLILHFYFYTFDFRVFFLLSPMFICAPSVQVHNLEHPCMSHKYSNRVQGNTGSSSSREWGTWLVWCNS